MEICKMGCSHFEGRMAYSEGDFYPKRKARSLSEKYKKILGADYVLLTCLSAKS